MPIELVMILVCALGVLFGVFITSWIWHRREYGVFVIDCSDVNKDVCRIELDSMDLDALARKKYIVLEVDANIPDSRD